MNIETARKVCALWWAHQILHGGANWNNGDDSPQGGLMSIMANMLQDKSREETSQQNEDIFVAELIHQLEHEPSAKHHLSVDYNPDYALFLALKKAGIKPECCPCKTTTWIVQEGDEYKVFASLGYRAERVEITKESLGKLEWGK